MYIQGYNSYGEITEVSDESFTYQLSQRDNAGAITQKKETLNGTTTTYNYTYDTMGRLTEVKQNGSTVEAYTYDNNGNRASATVNNETISASYTLDDNLVVYGDNSYRYDDDGYLMEKVTPDGTTAYAYGTMGQLLAVDTPEHNVSYRHNALNQRVAKLIDGVVVEKYLWADLTTLLAVYDGSDNLVQRFAYADQRMPVSMMMGGEKYYLHYDQVGSLRAISDTSHHIVKEVTYDTYGKLLTDSNTSFKVPFGFAGGLYDSDTKLTRFGYREYDAFTGKWTAKDPIGFAGGDSNLYGYVLGDPVNWVDLNGLQGFDPAFGVPSELMQPVYRWFDNIFGAKPPPPPSTFDKIYDGLSRDIPRAYSNAHPAARMCLDVALTGTEWGLTAGLPLWASVPLDIYSGANFPTMPNSIPGWLSNLMSTPLY